jgi:hypothetical protein
MLFKFSSVYNVDRFVTDHDRPAKYHLRRPAEYPTKQKVSDLLVHLKVNAAATGSAGNGSGGGRRNVTLKPHPADTALLPAGGVTDAP